jgi:hypothetical protein
MSADTGSSFDTRGALSSFRPASCDRRLPLRVFTCLLDHTRFCHVSGPPRERGRDVVQAAFVRAQQCAGVPAAIVVAFADRAGANSPSRWTLALRVQAGHQSTNFSGDAEILQNRELTRLFFFEGAVENGGEQGIPLGVVSACRCRFIFFKSSVMDKNYSRAASTSNCDLFCPFWKGGHRVKDVVQFVGVGVFLPAATTTPCRLVTWTAVGVDSI